MYVGVKEEKELEQEFVDKIDDLMKNQSQNLKVEIQNLLDFVLADPDYASDIICTGSIQEIVDQVGVVSYNGPIRTFFEIYKDVYDISSDEKIREKVAASAFVTKRPDELSSLQFSCKRFRSTTIRIHSEKQFSTIYASTPIFMKAYDRYEANASIRKEHLSVLEAHGYFENDIENAYGLIVRIDKDNQKMKVPDFIHTGEDGISAIYIVNRKNTDEDECKFLYSNYKSQFPEYYVWTGYELDRFVRMLKENDPNLNWKACDGSYRGIGTMVWDLLNNSEFVQYYQTHSSADVARKFGIKTHQLHYISNKYPEIKQVSEDSESGDLVTTRMLSLINGSDRDLFFLITEDDPRYEEANEFLQANDENYKDFKEIFDDIGYIRNRCYDNSIIACGSNNAPCSEIFIPDVVHFDFENRNRRFGALMIGNLKRDVSPECIQILKELNAKFKRGKIGIVWEQEIEAQYAKYGSSWPSCKAFGRIGYKGSGTVNALDLKDASLYRLSHTDKEFVFHYGLENLTVDEVRIFFKNKTLDRKTILENRMFPELFQTVDRLQLGLDEDTVINLGSYREGRKVYQLWRTASCEDVENLYKRQTSWCTYDRNEDFRKGILLEMEQALHLVENRIESPYGLVYLEEDDGTVAIPDFIDLRSVHMFVFMLNDIGYVKSERSELLAAFETSQSLYVGCGTWLGFTCALESQLKERLESGQVSRQNWHRQLLRFRAKYILDTIHFVELKKEKELQLQRESLENLSRRDERIELAAEKVARVEKLDQAVNDFEKASAGNFVFNSSGDIIGYNCDSSLISALEKNNYVGLFKAGQPLESRYFKETYSAFMEKDPEAWQLAPFMEKLGCVRNSVLNSWGLVFIDNFNMQRCFIPDFIGISDDGKFCYVKLMDKDADKVEFDVVAAFHRQATRSQIRRGLMLWSGFHTTCFKHAIISGEYNNSLLKVQYLGKGNVVWDMLNDPNFKEYYWSHSADETCEHYGVKKSQLEHVVYIHQEFRRPNNAQRIINLSKANMSRQDDYDKVDNHMVSKEEMSLSRYLERIGIFHNDSENFDNHPVVFGGLGVKTLLPDFVSKDRSVIVEFDGEYYHLDPKEAEFRRTYYEHIGKTCCIIWEAEYDEFVSNPPESVDELIQRYPCTWRNYRAEEYYVLHHDYDHYLEQLLEKIEIEKQKH